MLILFVIVFLACVAPLIRPRLSRWAIFAVSGYFWAVENLIINFFSAPFEAVYQKFLNYLLIIFPPVFLLILHRPQSRSRFVAAILLCFLVLLPCSGPTIPFSRAASHWKLSHFPIRYAENISRLRPDTRDLAVLEASCSQLMPAVRTRLIGQLRSSKEFRDARICANTPNQIPLEKVQEFHSDAEWNKIYTESGEERKIEILNELKEQKNPVLTDAAIQTLDSRNDALILSSVYYLREISGEGIGNDPVRWKEWRDQDKGGIRTKLLAPGKGNPLVNAGFSALQVQADLFEARESGQDFLRYYLKHHFPRNVSDEDLVTLRQTLQQMQGIPETNSTFYKKGMIYFFIALAETVRLSEENGTDTAEVASHWRSSLENFQLSGFPGEGMTRELHEIISKADSNADGELSRAELVSIVSL